MSKQDHAKNARLQGTVKSLLEASCFTWDGDILKVTFPPSRTLAISSPKCAGFWMTEPEIRSTIRLLQAALVKTGRAMQPPLTDEQIAWWTKDLEHGNER